MDYLRSPAAQRVVDNNELARAAQAVVDHSYHKRQDPEVSIPVGYFDDLRAALAKRDANTAARGEAQP